MVHQYQKEAKKRQARYADNNSQYTKFQEGDLNNSSTKVSYRVGCILIIE